MLAVDSLGPMFNGHPIPGDNRVPARVQFAFSMLRHFAQITDPLSDEDQQLMGRDLNPQERKAYDQSLLTVSQWIAMEHEFRDAEPAPAWRDKPLHEGAYAFTPDGQQILAGGVVAVYVDEGQAFVSIGNEQYALPDWQKGWWYGPMPLPPGSRVELSDLPSEETDESPVEKEEQ